MPWNLIIMLALMVLSAAITALTAKAPQTPIPPAPAALGEFNIPQIEEGTAQIVIFGDVWLTDWQVLWYGNLSSEEIMAAPVSGGKK